MRALERGEAQGVGLGDGDTLRPTRSRSDTPHGQHEQCAYAHVHVHVHVKPYSGRPRGLPSGILYSAVCKIQERVRDGIHGDSRQPTVARHRARPRDRHGATRVRERHTLHVTQLQTIPVLRLLPILRCGWLAVEVRPDCVCEACALPDWQPRPPRDRVHALDRRRPQRLDRRTGGEQRLEAARRLQTRCELVVAVGAERARDCGVAWSQAWKAGWRGGRETGATCPLARL